MLPNAIRTHCPHCGDAAAHAFLPSPSMSNSPAGDRQSCDVGPTAKHRLICSRCETSWEAAIVPWEQIKQLRAAAESLDEARRQIAMLRLIMSKDQLGRAETSQADTIKLHRAA